MQKTVIHNQDSIQVVSAAAFNSRTAQTPGSQRLAAISYETGIGSSMWGGLFVVDPDGKTAIHHHGEQDTIAYVLEGAAVLRWGRQGEFHATARAGDFLYVPAFLPHQEINPSKESSFRWVVVRSTSEPIIINLPDDYWPEAS